MTWTTSETLAMSRPDCPKCKGAGMRTHGRGESAQQVPCGCVFRAIFRACLAEFKCCATDKHAAGTVTLVRRMGRSYYQRSRDEYVADFCLVAKRSLGAGDWRVFNLHYLASAPFQVAAQKCCLSQNEFWARVRFIQERLGRVFAELEPYPLWPIDDYLGRLESAA